jgi:hypothetical protein
MSKYFLLPELNHIIVEYTGNTLPCVRHSDLNWNELSENLEAIHLLEQNTYKIDWDILLENEYIYIFNEPLYKLLNRITI